MHDQLVTIAIPVYNGERYLADAIASAQAQTHNRLEILIADNASTDRTREIAESAARDYDRVRVIGADENRGAAWNYNRLVDEAHGQYFQWLAHDDLITPEAIELCLDAMVNRPEVALAHPESSIIDEHGNFVRDHNEFLDLDLADPVRRATRLLLNVRMCHAVFGLYNTSILRDTKLIQVFDSSDYTLLVEIALRGRIVQVDGRHFLRRRHAGDSRSANRTAADLAAWFGRSDSRRIHLGGRSPELVRSFSRAAIDWADSPLSTALSTTALASVGVATEVRWHKRRVVRERHERAREAQGVS